MSEISEIYRAIAAYATAYGRLQGLQRRKGPIPPGDQKTGCIGEFYAYLYLQAKYPEAILSYGQHSEKGWDIKVVSPERTWRVQVKTVSEYALTRSISPIHCGWDELFVILLGKDLTPKGFWRIADNAIVAKGEVLKGCKCRRPGVRSSGSKIIAWDDDLIEEFRRLVLPQLSG